MSIPSWYHSDEPGDRLGEGIFIRIKAELDPTEFLLGPTVRWRPAVANPAGPRVVHFGAGWSERVFAGGTLRPGRRSLARSTDHGAGTGVGPCVLGGMIFAHLVSLMIRRRPRRRWLARMVYAVTDHRAIVARIEDFSGQAPVVFPAAGRDHRHAQVRESGRIGRSLLHRPGIRPVAAHRFPRGFLRGRSGRGPGCATHS